MVIMRPQTQNVERNKQLRWLRQLRERAQHLSIAFRPRMVRMMWMRFTNKEDMKILVEATS